MHLAYLKGVLEFMGMEIRKRIRRSRSKIFCIVDKRDFCGACDVASYILWNILTGIGYNAYFVVGMFDEDVDHCWVEIDRKLIVDITATQFGNKYPEVFLTSKRNRNYSKVDDGNKAINHVRMFWHAGHAPWDCRCYHNNDLLVIERITNEVLVETQAWIASSTTVRKSQSQSSTASLQHPSKTYRKSVSAGLCSTIR